MEARQKLLQYIYIHRLKICIKLNFRVKNIARNARIISASCQGTKRG